MKKLIFLLFVTLVLSACSTPFDQIVAASTHFQGAKHASIDAKGAVSCPPWAGNGLCILEAQTLIPDSDWALQVPIVSYTVGHVQLNQAIIVESQNLDWFLEDGVTPIQITEMQEGVFYIYHKVGSPAGFYLAKK